MSRRGFAVRDLRPEDMIVLNSPWDFWGLDGLGINEWGIVITSTCKHSYEPIGERDEEDTKYQEFFQCTKCREKMFVRVTFGCPVCKGRHVQFLGYLGSAVHFCPQDARIPFYKKDIQGAHLEVKFMHDDDESSS